MNIRHRRFSVGAIIIAVLTVAVGCGDVRPSKTLHKAVLTTDLVQIKRHIHWNSNLNARDELGLSSLDYAAMKGSVKIAELLIKHGADPNARGLYRQTPLQKAAQNGNTGVIELLIAKIGRASCRERV